MASRLTNVTSSSKTFWPLLQRSQGKYPPSPMSRVIPTIWRQKHFGQLFSRSRLPGRTLALLQAAGWCRPRNKPHRINASSNETNWKRPGKSHGHHTTKSRFSLSPTLVRSNINNIDAINKLSSSLVVRATHNRRQPFYRVLTENARGLVPTVKIDHPNELPSDGRHILECIGDGLFYSLQAQSHDQCTSQL